jgi:hypothetical protein
MMGVLRFDSRRGLGTFLFTTASRTALRCTQPPIQWVPGALFLGVQRPTREANHSLPPSAEVKNAWSYTCTPQYFFIAWCLIKHSDKFTFTFKATTRIQSSSRHRVGRNSYMGNQYSIKSIPTFPQIKTYKYSYLKRDLNP